MSERRVFLTQDDAAQIGAGLSKVRELAESLAQQTSPSRDHTNWQLVQFVCDEQRPDGYFQGKVMLGEGKELGDCHLRSGVKAIDLTAYYAAVMVETVIDEAGRVTPVFFVPASDSAVRFMLLEDLFHCSSARAVPVFYKGGKWCDTDGRCPVDHPAYSGDYSGGADEGDESGSGSGTPGQEITVYDSTGLRVPDKRRRADGKKVPGLLGEKDDVGWAIFKGDSQKWELLSIGDSCCPNEQEESGSGLSGQSGYQSDCCEIEVLDDVDYTFSCVGGTLTATKTKTYKTYRVACCDE